MYEYDLVQRIREIYDSCDEREKYFLYKILHEIAESDDGRSQTYEDIWLADYKEIPVGINTFLESDLYLGKTNRNGEAVFPYWRRELNTIFGSGNKIYEWILTGPIRIGKTVTANTGAEYMLYKLMCLRNPQKFFGKKENSAFSLLFFNLTKDLAKGVAFREFNAALKFSPWFNAHGHFTDSEENPVYIPEGGLISIEYGSTAAHGLGKQVFCLVGNTKIITSKGIEKLSDVAGKSIEVQQLHNGNLIYTPATVEKTADTNVTIRITLEDGTIIEGTPDHRIMLSDGTYKRLSDITEDDDIFGVSAAKTKVRKTKIIRYKTPIPVYDVINAEPSHNFVIRGESTDFISHNCCVCDEVNFAKAGVKDINKAKRSMKENYDTIMGRITSTFKHGGEVFGKMFVCSSKNADCDFLSEHIEKQQSAGADFMHISDAPQWEVMPPDTFSKERFYIAVGSRHQRGFVVEDSQAFPEALEDIRNQGFKIVEVPMEMKPNFKADFEISLRDLAGIAVPGSMSFITQDVIDECITNERRNPFYTDTLQIGTRDSLRIEDYFHIEEIPMNILRAPTYIHYDLALVNDRAGISGVSLIGRRDVEIADGKKVSVPLLAHTFTIGIEAPRGAQIAYDKIKLFTIWLRSKGMNIVGVSRDQFQSEYLGQLLAAAGFDDKKLSLDRTPDGYVAFRSILTEHRISLLDVKLLQDELIHLQRDSITGKVDHPVGGGKDLSDSLAGAVWNAVLSNDNIPVSTKSVAKVVASVNRRGVTVADLNNPLSQFKPFRK